MITFTNLFFYVKLIAFLLVINLTILFFFLSWVDLRRNSFLGYSHAALCDRLLSNMSLKIKNLTIIVKTVFQRCSRLGYRLSLWVKMIFKIKLIILLVLDAVGDFLLVMHGWRKRLRLGIHLSPQQYSSNCWENNT